MAALAACKLSPLFSSNSVSRVPCSRRLRDGGGVRRRVGNGDRRRGRTSVCAALSPEAVEAVSSLPAPLFSLADGGSLGYSLASYYTSLGLFVISVPGLWSLIKRSVKSKIVQKTFELGQAKPPSQVAGEILSFFTRNNFSVADRGETITFEGVMVPSRGQAALLTFCTCISLASVGLVLSITFPQGGNYWFLLTLLSPAAGAYYWKRASRKEEIKVKMIVAEDGSLLEILVRGDDQQVEQMRKELQLSEKGMVYVKGLFERGGDGRALLLSDYTRIAISGKVNASQSQRKSKSTQVKVNASQSQRKSKSTFWHRCGKFDYSVDPVH